MGHHYKGSGGYKGREGRPPGPNSFNFMQFLENFGEIVCWRPPMRLAPSPRGNPGSATESVGQNFLISSKLSKIKFSIWAMKWSNNRLREWDLRQIREILDPPLEILSCLMIVGNTR